MLIECFGNHAKLQAFANAVREPIEYYEEEKCGRWYVDIQSHGDWSWAAAKIRDLSHDFRLVVYDGGIDGLGPSIFRQPGAKWDAHYRVEMEDGYYRILDESWGCDDEAPMMRLRMVRLFRSTAERCIGSRMACFTTRR